MTVVLGVDGGGTKTHVLAVDERGEVLGAAVNGPSNWELVGLGGTGAALRVAVAEALQQANLEPEDIDASVFGLAGVDWPADLELLGFAIDPLGIGGPRQIVNDAFVALRAGARHAWGVVVIAGSGSVAAGRSPEGEVFRTLGLGRMYGDFGSATDVSEEAVLAVAKAYTGRGPGTALTDLLCEHVGCGSPEDLLERLSREQHAGRVEYEVGNIAPIVIAAANAGDLVARGILEGAGASLGESAVLVARRLGMLDLEFDFVLSGGLITGASRFVSDPFEVVVRRVAPAATFVHLATPPVAGATLMALEMAGVAPEADVRARLAAGAKEAFLKETA